MSQTGYKNVVFSWKNDIENQTLYSGLSKNRTGQTRVFFQK